MAVNESKKKSPNAWRKWLESGSISGVRLKRHPSGFCELTFTGWSRTVGETAALMEKCGYRGCTMEELTAFVANPALPEPEPYVPFIDWLDDRWDGCYAPSLISF